MKTADSYPAVGGGSTHTRYVNEITLEQIRQGINLIVMSESEGIAYTAQLVVDSVFPKDSAGVVVLKTSEGGEYPVLDTDTFYEVR